MWSDKKGNHFVEEGILGGAADLTARTIAM